jgi:hypothetical protein
LFATAALAQGTPPPSVPPTYSPAYPPQQPPPPQQPYPPQQPPPPQQPYPPQQPPPPQQPYPPQPPYPQPPYQPTYPAQPYPQPTPYAYPADPWQVRPAPPPEERVHRFSATLSLLQPLLFSTYQGAGEFRLGKQAGLALALGVGTISLQKFDKTLPDEGARIWQLGSQIRFYPVGSFEHGMQLGAEFFYLFGSASATGSLTLGPGQMTPPGNLTATGTGLKIGAFVGYKLVLPVGFTVEAQAGIGYLSLKGVARDEAGHSKSADYKSAVPLANASVGWSF